MLSLVLEWEIISFGKRKGERIYLSTLMILCFEEGFTLMKAIGYYGQITNLRERGSNWKWSVWAQARLTVIGVII